MRGSILIRSLVCGSVAWTAAAAQGPVATAILRDGSRVAGRLAIDRDAIRFEPERDGAAVEWADLAAIEPRHGADRGPGAEAEGPFRLLFGRGLALSGRLESVDGSTIGFRPVEGERSISVDRAGVVSIRQRPGRALVLSEGFDSIDPSRWRVEGTAGVVEGAAASPGRMASLAAGGATLAHRLSEPLDAGRVDLLFRRETVEAVGHSALVEFGFEGLDGPASIRAVVGWGEEFPGAVSRGGASLVVQPLVLRDGWHRLSIRFGADRVLLSIDGDLLASGGGPGGPLTEVRVRTESSARATGPEGLSFQVDDLEVVRSFESTASAEYDPSQDEVRLIGGDQIWGRLASADAEGLRLEIDGRVVPFAWSEVAGVELRSGVAPSRPVEGPLGRVEWAELRGPDQPDRLEGAIVELTDERLVLDAPYVGRLSIETSRLARIVPLGRGRLVVLDPGPHHLGDQPIPELDPVLPESDRLDLDFELDEAPAVAPRLWIDVVDVEGDVEGSRFAEAIRKGELVTRVVLNGEPLGTLNERVRTTNKAPERLEIDVPAGLLVAGPNRLSLIQTGRADEPTYRDDLGILAIAVVW